MADLSNGTSNVVSFLKRAEDLLIGSVITIIILPLLLIIAVLIKVTSKGPIIFIQKRYGLNGQVIRVFKFRSMTVCEDGDNVIQATKHDLRITKVGAFLRKTSLDELPQFFNVLIGSMSIVGPRPHPLSLDDYYKDKIEEFSFRYRVKPGITGLAQVNGWRGETDTIEKMRKRLEFDRKYIDDWSLLIDIKIILLTILTGFGNKNAY